VAASIEDTLDALVAKLNTNLEAKITSINAAVTDGHTLDNPHAIEDHAVGELEAYPTVLVLPDESEPELDPGQYMIVWHRVQTVAFLESWDTEKLAKQVMRYLKAIKETLMVDRRPGTAGGAGGWDIRWMRDEYGPLFRPDNKAVFVQGARSLFRARQQQNF
jgi:hypothetical protein